MGDESKKKPEGLSDEEVEKMYAGLPAHAHTTGLSDEEVAAMHPQAMDATDDAYAAATAFAPVASLFEGLDSANKTQPAREHLIKKAADVALLGHYPETAAATKNLISRIANSKLKGEFPYVDPGENKYQELLKKENADMAADKSRYPISSGVGTAIGVGGSGIATGNLGLNETMFQRGVQGLGMYAASNFARNPGQHSGGPSLQLEERLRNTAASLNPLEHPIATASSVILPVVLGMRGTEEGEKFGEYLKNIAFMKKWKAFSPKAKEYRGTTPESQSNAGRVMLEEGDQSYLQSREHMGQQAEDISENIGKELQHEFETKGTVKNIPAEQLIDEVTGQVASDNARIPGDKFTAAPAIKAHLESEAADLAEPVATGTKTINTPARTETYTEPGAYGESVTRQRTIPATSEEVETGANHFSAKDLWEMAKGVSEKVKRSFGKDPSSLTAPEEVLRTTNTMLRKRAIEGLPKDNDVAELSRRYHGAETAQTALKNANVRDSSRMDVGPMDAAGVVVGQAGASGLKAATHGDNATAEVVKRIVGGLGGLATAKFTRAYGNNIQAQGLYNASKFFQDAKDLSAMGNVAKDLGPMMTKIPILSDQQIKDDFQKRAK